MFSPIPEQLQDNGSDVFGLHRQGLRAGFRDEFLLRLRFRRLVGWDSVDDHRRSVVPRAQLLHEPRTGKAVFAAAHVGDHSLVIVDRKQVQRVGCGRHGMDRDPVPFKKALFENVVFGVVVDPQNLADRIGSIGDDRGRLAELALRSVRRKRSLARDRRTDCG